MKKGISFGKWIKCMIVSVCFMLFVALIVGVIDDYYSNMVELTDFGKTFKRVPEWCFALYSVLFSWAINSFLVHLLEE